MNINQRVCFILNNEVVDAMLPPGFLLLDYLRNHQLLTGTKEGCKEGDCGACTVIVGELCNDVVTYRPMTSCLIPVGEMLGKHVVSIEGLNLHDLSPIQKAMVVEGGTQCGYCTPGFIVSLSAWLMDSTKPLNRDGLMHAISGNLCRCTGYRSIKDAGLKVAQKLRPETDGKDRIDHLCNSGHLPGYFLGIPDQLKEMQPKITVETEQVEIDPSARFRIAGGTDLYVQKGEEIPDTPVAILNDTPVPEARESDNFIMMDARMTFESMSEDPLIRKTIPDIRKFNELIASWPVRTRSTLGGNIVNASPIADMTVLLLALDSSVEITSDGHSRWHLLKDFYLGYKQLAKSDDEIITRIRFGKPDKNTYINWEKVSKRAWLDIASVNSAGVLKVADGIIDEAHLSLGGVAPIPLHLKEASGFLKGKMLKPESVWECIEIAMDEISPISDVRGSAEYKRLLARQLLLTHFTKLFPAECPEQLLYEAY